jgi:GntR family transcriptional regulator
MATTYEILGKLTARCEQLREDGNGRLPSERVLAEELQASRSTVRRALNILAESGVITVARGRNGGAHVVSAKAAEPLLPEHHLLALWSSGGGKISRSLSQVAAIPLTLSEQGLDVGIHVLSLSLEVPDAHVASQLHIEPSEPVICLLRLRFADGAPLSLERMYLSFARFPRLVNEGLRGAASMYVMLQERYGVAIAGAEEDIEIAAATPEVAQLLAIKPGDPVLVLRRLARDAEGEPVECSFDLFRGDRTRLTVRTLDLISQKSLSAPEAGAGLAR